MDVSSEAVQELSRRLLDTSLPIERRFRALFSLRNLKGDGPRMALSAALKDKSSLLAHESAFALGQMQQASAIPALKEVLSDYEFHPMVRHEAAEALGAIGTEECKILLHQSLGDPAAEVRETCELALRRIQENSKEAIILEPTTMEATVHSKINQDSGDSPFLTVDPAQAASSDKCTEELRCLLLDESAAMYDRYSALFALRNRRDPDAVQAIVKALEASSALLRHEVAYVLGQLQDVAAAEALMCTLSNQEEHPMVRHEAAEALGAIADTKSIKLLQKYQNDNEPIVAESCDVALDMIEFELQGNFQYADVDVGASPSVLCSVQS